MSHPYLENIFDLDSHNLHTNLYMKLLPIRKSKLPKDFFICKK